MDNIQKMLVGVISVAGLIALVVPESDPIAPDALEAPAEAAAPAVAAAPPPPPPAPSPMQYDADSSGGMQSGQPTIDGNPIQADFGLPLGTSAQSTTSNADAGQSNQASGYTPPAFNMPGSAPAAESGNNASTTSDANQ